MDSNTAPSIRALLEPRSRATNQPNGSHASVPALDDEQEYVAYAYGRIGTRPQLSLAFRKANGSVKAFTYTHLFSVESENPAEGFTVTFSGTKIVIRGTNLAHLFRLVCLHKAAEIVEARRSEALEAAKDAPVVESIDFE